MWMKMKNEKKVYFTFFLLFVFIVNSFAQSQNDKRFIPGSSTPVKGITPPPQAVEAGYKTLVFNDDFDSINTIDVKGTNKSGYKWYVDGPIWSSGIVDPSTYSVSNSVLALSNNTWSANWMLSSFSCHGNVGHSFKYGYFEARLRFDPALGKKARGWPAWWSLSTHHSRTNDPAHWAELDFFEAYTGGKADYTGAFIGTLHDWADDSKTHYQNSNNWQNQPTTDYNQWHTYGCLWSPGKVIWYFDGVAKITQIYSATAPPSPLANGTITPTPAGIFNILDNDPEGMLLILGSDEWPMYVDWVRVWQSGSDDKNRTQSLNR